MKDGIYVRIVTFVNRITVCHRKTSNVNFQVILAGGSLPGEICVSQNVIFISNLGIPTFFLLVLGGYLRHPWREDKVHNTEDSVKKLKNNAKGFDRKL